MNPSTMQTRIDILEQGFAATAGAFYNINLSQDLVPGVMYQVIDGVRYSLNEQMGLPEDVAFSQVVAFWGRHVPDNERDAYEAFFDIGNLLASFRAGRTHLSHTYWTKSALFEPMLAEQHVVMYLDDDSGDVLAVSYVVDKTERFQLLKDSQKAVLEKTELEKLLQMERKSSAMLTALSSAYAQIFEIDLATDRFAEVFTEREVRSEAGYRTGSVHEGFPNAIERFIHADHREAVREFLDIETLPQRLSGVDIISIEYLTSCDEWAASSFIAQQRDEQGNPLVVLFTVKRIDEQKRLELDYKRQLEASAEQAERANNAKTDFLRRMSHDIRTPINGIIGMIDIANRHLDDPEKLAECHAKELSAAQYLLSLVNDVLDVAKLETGDIIVHSEPFDLVPLLLDSVAISETYANQHGVRFFGGKSMSRFSHRHLLGSPELLNRLLMNVASNAVKYNRPDGSITLYCNELDCSQGTATFEFVCEDTGIGMSEDFVAHAFEPYAQEGRGDAGTFNGTGLGLSIVKSIVDQMGGDISIASKLDVGTKVRIVIPFAVDPDEAGGMEPSAPVPVADVSGKRVMLVDDNELNREIASEMLTDLGLEVTCAANGREAVDAFAASKPGHFDFILMDVLMPVMDGLEAARAIRAFDRPDAKSVALFALSANAFSDDVQASLDAGMDAHLTKPLETGKLLAAMTQALLR